MDEDLVVEPTGQLGRQVVLLGDGRDAVKEFLLLVFALYRVAVLRFRLAERIDDGVALRKQFDDALVDLVNAGAGYIVDEEDGSALEVRRIRLLLDEPTRDGETEIVVLTNVSEEDAFAEQVALLYRRRWTIERAFQELSDHQEAETRALGYPKAALFGFAVGFVSYNVPRGPKKPPPQRTKNRDKPHVSTAKLHAQRKDAPRHLERGGVLRGKQRDVVQAWRERHVEHWMHCSPSVCNAGLQRIAGGRSEPFQALFRPR